MFIYQSQNAISKHCECKDWVCMLQCGRLLWMLYVVWLGYPSLLTLSQYWKLALLNISNWLHYAGSGSTQGDGNLIFHSLCRYEAFFVLMTRQCFSQREWVHGLAWTSGTIPDLWNHSNQIWLLSHGAPVSHEKMPPLKEYGWWTLLVMCAQTHRKLVLNLSRFDKLLQCI